MRDIGTMGEAQWVIINLVNSSDKTVVVKNVSLKWGKFYRNNDKSDEIPTSDIENHKISPQDEFTIYSCGRSNAASGTEGDFNVYEDGAGGQKVRHFYWDCPWGSKTNTWTISERNVHWVVDSEGANLDSGALGTITVEMIKKA